MATEAKLHWNVFTCQEQTVRSEWQGRGEDTSKRSNINVIQHSNAEILSTL